MIKAEITLSVEIFDINSVISGRENGPVPQAVADKLMAELGSKFLGARVQDGKYLITVAKVRHVGSR